MKHRIFIGSASENDDIAQEIHSYFDYDKDVEAIIWHQDVFKLSSNALDDLLQELAQTDFAIFVFQPTDILKMREKKYRAVRDNVIFELGLFFGRLGKGRVFYLIPRNCPDLHLPSDLIGVTPGTYNSERTDNRLSAAISPFCREVKKAIKNAEVTQTNLGVKSINYFEKFSHDFEKIFNAYNDLTVYFIHARSWRETHHDSIRKFLSVKGNHLTVIMPDILDDALIEILVKNFDDGQYIPSLIKDAYKFFLELKAEFNNITIKVSRFYPTYSFYKYDSNVIIALYPTTPKKKNVPAFTINHDAELWKFFLDDYDVLLDSASELTRKHLQQFKKE